ncbi:chemotaxis protein CheW [Sphingomonas rosea]|jgi:purine-binding chemotaxis protein CheW|uniref:Chemotaxis protein CheW n=1 Tax=Sphingomonas rosea TaxID=335605 RepID=A0ABP7U0B0_9SPHN
MSGGELQVVTFGLDAETFAIPVTLVREILDYREPFRIPNGPGFMLGLTDLRGEGVTTVDLRLRLGMPAAVPSLSTRILVVDVPLGARVLTLGLVVDRVLDVSTVDTAQIGPAPDVGTRWASDYIAGVARRAEGFVVFIDMGRIFSDVEAAELSSMATAA